MIAGIRLLGEIFRIPVELIAGADVDRNDLIRRAGLFQENGDLVAVGVGQ